MADTSLLPLGGSSFETLRQANCLYVDKTELIYQLASSRAPIFLSRPRRFGKSLLVSTFESLFKYGTRDFKGLWIEDKWKDKTYRVLHIDFSSIGKLESEDQIIEAFNSCFEDAVLEAGLSLDEADHFQETSVSRFTRAIFRKLEPNSTALLIDEYDAPLIHNLDNPEIFEKVRKIMTDFYALTKSRNGRFRFVFITGITRYRGTSIFSGLNNLRDISLDPVYATLLGYTDEELRKYFMPYIEDAAKVLECTTDDVLASLKEHYDGYCFSPENHETVYTPWSILNFMVQPYRGYRGYWYDSGGLPTIVVKYIQSDKIQASLGKLTQDVLVDIEDLKGFNSLADMPLNILMYQTGYLTIKKALGESIQLGFPNQEIRQAILRLYRRDVLKLQFTSDFTSSYKEICDAIQKEDAQKLAELFSYVLNNVSHKTFKDEETIRDVLAISFFHAKNVIVNIETQTAKGRSDMLLTYNKHRYVFEFKRQSEKNPDADKLLQEAKDQIIDRRYDQLQPMDLPVTAFAMVIDEESRKIVRAEKL